MNPTFEHDRISRRSLLLSLPALMMAPRALLQNGSPPIRVTGINHVTLRVSDVKRSVDFYQGLFGMPVISRQGTTNANLRIGAGPQFLGFSAAGSEAPNINHICLGVDNFNVDRIIGILGQHGITKGDSAGPMKVRVRMRGPEAGGAKEGTPELSFGDPDGIVIQLQDPRYCGGAGALGNVCPAPEASPKKGLLALRDWSHCTNFVSDAARSNKFYQDLFGFDIQVRRWRRRSRRRERRASSCQYQSPLHEHGKFPPGFRHQDSRKLRHQTERKRARGAGTARPLHQHADGESRRREGRHAGTIFYGSRRPADPASGCKVLRRRRRPR